LNLKAEKQIEARAAFDIIRYANCWEDADIVLEALDVKAGKTYLSIASAGDNTLGIIASDPHAVVAVDVSQAQLSCLELRVSAFRYLSYEELIEFLGLHESSQRLVTYGLLRSTLSRDARQFWDENKASIDKGIIHVGKFENYFRLFRKWVLPLVHSRNEVEDLLREKTGKERATFYRETWNTIKWRLFFKIFFSRVVMGRLGRDPEFFKFVDGDVAKKIMLRAELALAALPLHENPYLAYILTGNYKGSLPYYLRPENYEKIRKNLNKLIIFQGNVIEALQAHSELKFDGFNLSDIFEYMSYDQYTNELLYILGASTKGARLVYWNMLVDRQAPEKIRDKLQPMYDIMLELFPLNKAFFYKSLVVERVL
jgi:S-adenosylmethionine-diacylglycerol 3-amino-3-carboxypropyl transferase